jgi:hypothetical protein
MFSAFDHSTELGAFAAQIKKNHPDHIGVILYNVKSNDSSLYEGVYQLLELGPLGREEVDLIRDHAGKWVSGSHIFF